MAFTQVTLTGTYKLHDGTAASGSVTFTASSVMKNGTDVRPPLPLSVTLDVTGAFSVVLPSTEDAGTSPTGVTYEVLEQIQGSPSRAYSVALSTTTPQDLSAIAVTTNTTTYTYALLANNLSDLPNAATARTNLGLGTAATHASTDFDAAGAASAAQTAAESFATSAIFTQHTTDIGTFYPLPTGTPTVGQVAKVTQASPLTVGWGAAGSTLPGVLVTDHGAVADAVTLSDGAMTAASAVLTSATAGFTAGDVGKRVVVNNALGTGVHLYTTISAYTNATTVTLAANATATITSAIFSYGTDDLAAWNAAIAACPSGGVVVAPPSPSMIYGTLTITKALTILGYGATPFSGVVSNHASVWMPAEAPFLGGSTIVQAQASVDCLYSNQVGVAINLRDVGIYFAGMFYTTGHGINFESANLGSGNYDNGQFGAAWENVHILGHDATHYAVRLVNPLLSTLTHVMSYGGGGFDIAQVGTLNPYGNLVLNHPYHCKTNGSVDSFLFETNSSVKMNLITMVRPQDINLGSSGKSGIYAPFSLAAQSGYGFNFNGAANINTIGLDQEGGTMAAGNAALGIFGSYDLTIAGAPDSAPLLLRQYPGTRRMNQDGSVSLDTLEGAGSSLWLLRDNVKSTIWGIATDGTNRMYVPGTFQLTGGMRAGTVGAALGTTPPPVVASGSDMSGTAMFGSGTAPTTGNALTIPYASASAYAKAVTITPLNAATEALGLYVAGSTTTGFTVGVAAAPTASQPAGTYEFAYVCLDAGGLAPSSVSAYDSYTKADNATTVGSPQIGTAPTAVGTWGISSNAAYLVSGALSALTYTSASANATVMALMQTVGSGGAGVIARYANINNMIYANWGGTLYKVVAGTFTLLGNFPNPASGQTLALTCTAANELIVSLDGLKVLSVTDAAGSANTGFGLICGGTGTDRFQNLTVAPL